MKIEVCKHCRGHVIDTKGFDILEEIKKYEKLFVEKNIEFQVEETGCLGGCEAPMIKINGEAYGKVDAEKLEEILNSLL